MQCNAPPAAVFPRLAIPMQDLFSALCLVAILEGLFLFAAPLAWKRMAARLLELPAAALRQSGAVLLAIGLAALWWLRH